MTGQHQQPPDDPPQRPLRVHVSVRGQLGDGSTIVATAWRTLEPHEPEYEQAYQEAARYPKTAAIFAGALAAVRAHLWASRNCAPPSDASEQSDSAATFWASLVEIACYAA